VPSSAMLNSTFVMLGTFDHYSYWQNLQVKEESRPVELVIDRLSCKLRTGHRIRRNELTSL
jgi:hypothetical protein